MTERAHRRVGVGMVRGDTALEVDRNQLMYGKLLRLAKAWFLFYRQQRTVKQFLTEEEIYVSGHFLGCERNTFEGVSSRAGK